MTSSTSKCYVNRTGFLDDTAYVEVFPDGTSVIHTRSGQRNPIPHDFSHAIASGEWVEIENQAKRIGGAA